MTGFEAGLENWNSIHSNIIRANQGAKQLDIAQQSEDRLEKQQKIDKRQFKATEGRLRKQQRMEKRQFDRTENRLDAAASDKFYFDSLDDMRAQRKHELDLKTSQLGLRKDKSKFKQAQKDIEESTAAKDRMMELDVEIADLAREVIGASPEKLKEIKLKSLGVEQEMMRLDGQLTRLGSPSTSRGGRTGRSSYLGELIGEEMKTLEYIESEKGRVEAIARELLTNAHWKGRPQDKQKYDALGSKVSALRTQLAQPNVENRQQLVNEIETAENDRQEMEVEGYITQLYKDKGFDMRYAMANKKMWIQKEGHPMMNGDGSILYDPKTRSVIRHMGLDADPTIAAAKSYLTWLELQRKEGTLEEVTSVGDDSSKVRTKKVEPPKLPVDPMIGALAGGAGAAPGDVVTDTETITESRKAPFHKATTHGISRDIMDSIVDVDVGKFFDAIDAQGRAGGVTEEVLRQTQEAAQEAEVAAKDAAKDAVNIEMSKGAPNEKDAAAIAKRAQDYKPPDRYETKQKAETEAAGIDETSMGHMRRYIGGSKRELDRMTPIQITKKYRDKQQKDMEKSADKVSDMVYALLPGYAARVEGKEGGGLDTMRMADSVANAIRKFDKFDNILPHELGTITVYSKDGKHKEIIDVNWPKDEKTINKLRPLLEDIGKVKNNIKWADRVLNPPKRTKPGGEREQTRRSLRGARTPERSAPKREESEAKVGDTKEITKLLESAKAQEANIIKLQKKMLSVGGAERDRLLEQVINMRKSQSSLLEKVKSERKKLNP